MLRFIKYVIIGVAFFIFSSQLQRPGQLCAYVVVPRNEDDTTERMNSGGDRPTRPGLRDTQKVPEYLDDYWGVNDRYYSTQGIRETGKIRNPVYNSNNPPYYPLPNTSYDRTPYGNDYQTNYYRPGYAR